MFTTSGCPDTKGARHEPPKPNTTVAVPIGYSSPGGGTFHAPYAKSSQPALSTSPSAATDAPANPFGAGAVSFASRLLVHTSAGRFSPSAVTPCPATTQTRPWLPPPPGPGA